MLYCMAFIISARLDLGWCLAKSFSAKSKTIFNSKNRISEYQVVFSNFNELLQEELLFHIRNYDYFIMQKAH